MKRPSHKTITLVYLVIFLYIVGGLLLYKYQRMVILRPETLPLTYQFDFPVPFREYNIPVNDTDRLNLVWLRADSAKGIVLYFHGNTGDILNAYPHASPFLSNHYDVLLMDYPGFGKSRGSQSEKALYRDAVVSYQLARTRFGSDSIIVYGKSLGGAMAAYIAAHERCQALMLECPFYSFDQLARRYAPIYPAGWMLRYHFPVADFVKHTTAPVYIFHGKRDKTIPYRFSRRLKPLLKAGDRYITFPDGHHNDLSSQPGYRELVDSVLKRK